MSEKVLTSFVLARMPEAPAWSFYVGISADTAARILADPTEARGYILESFQHRDMGNLVRKCLASESIAYLACCRHQERYNYSITKQFISARPARHVSP